MLGKWKPSNLDDKEENSFNAERQRKGHGNK